MSKSPDELSKINAEAFEKVEKEKQKFKYDFGPLNKDKATIELEKIFNDLVEDSTKQDKSVKITLENGQLFYQKGTSDKVNLTDILSKANLTHLNIDPAIIETYSKIPAIHDNPATQVVKAGKIVLKEATKALTEEEFKVKINRATPEQKEYLNELTYGEHLAIYRYTSPEYAKINGLMRGDYRSFKKLGGVEEEKVKSTLMHTIVASAALQKMPDVDLPTVTRRVDNFGMDQMIENVKNNIVTQEKAFISTSFEDHDDFKKVYPNQIILKNVQGKDISAISYFGKEKEYLISPSTQLKWTGHTMNGENHIFTVEGSNVLLDQRMKKNASSTAVSMPNSSPQQLAKKASVEDALEDRGIDKVEVIRTMPNPKSEAMVSTSATSVEDTQKDKSQTSVGAEGVVNQAEWEGTRQILPTKKSQINIGENRIDSRLIDKEEDRLMPPDTPRVMSALSTSVTSVEEIQKDKSQSSVGAEGVVNQAEWEGTRQILPTKKSQINIGENRIDSRLIDKEEDRLMPPDSPRAMSALSTSATSVEDTQKDKLGERRIDSRLIDAARNIEHRLEDEGLVAHKSHEMEARPVSSISSAVVQTTHPVATKQHSLTQEVEHLETMPSQVVHAHTSVQSLHQEVGQAQHSLEKPKKPAHPGWALGISFGVAVSAVALAGPAGLPIAAIALSVGSGVAIYNGVKRYQIEKKYQKDLAVAEQLNVSEKTGKVHNQEQSKIQELEAPETPSLHIQKKHSR